MGQLCRILRSEYPKINFVSYPKVQGRPFTTTDIITKAEETLEQ